MITPGYARLPKSFDGNFSETANTGFFIGQNMPDDLSIT